MLLPGLSNLLAACLVGALGTRAAVEAQDPNIKSIPVRADLTDALSQAIANHILNKLRTHSMTPPYLDSDMNSRWFEFGGDTIVRADSYVRLTSDRPSQQGWLFSRVPLTATNWEIEVEFKIHGNGNLHGDGLAMWLTKQRATPGSVFGSTDRFEGLGIFFDTYKNNRPGVVFPYVMAMLGDGSTAYDQGNDGKANEIAGCSVREPSILQYRGSKYDWVGMARGIRGASNPTKAKLTYFQDKSLSLSLQYKADKTWTDCFTITHTSSSPITIPTVAYLGFSAETGELSDNHDIISIESRNLYSPTQYSDTERTIRQEKGTPSRRKKKASRARDSEGGSWGWFFAKLILFAMVVVGGYIGYTAWRTQKRNRF